jgi:hypothetical protein
MISGCWRFVAVAATALLLSSASGAATFVVDTFPDGVDVLPGDGVCATASGDCTVRAAVMEANALLGPDTVIVPAGTFPIERPWPFPEGDPSSASVGDLNVHEELTLVGAGSDETVIGPGSAMFADRILSIHAGPVTLRDLTIREGFAGFDPGVPNNGTAGGGILNFDTLFLDGVNVADNYADSTGGGILSYGSLFVARSSFESNSAYEGGAISLLYRGSAVIADSAFVSNSGSGNASALLMRDSGQATIVRSLFERNQGGEVVLGLNDTRAQIEMSLVRGNSFQGPLVDIRSGAIESSTFTENYSQDNIIRGSYLHPERVTLRGVTIARNAAFTPDQVTVSNSIIAENVPSSSLSGGCTSVVSAGHNLIGIGCAGFPFDTTDLVGTPESPIDPQLSDQLVGSGAAATYIPDFSSPAIDAGSSESGSELGACAETDQRGVSRPLDGNSDGVSRCDIGAFEAREPFVLTSGADGGDVDPGDGSCEATNGGCTFRAAVMESNAQAGPDRILVPSGAYAAQIGEDDPLAGISIVDDLEIRGVGEGSALITCAAGASHALLTVGARVLLSDLSIGECSATNASPLIANPGGDLTLERVKVVGFYSDRSSVIWSNGDLVVRESQFTGNSTENGAIEIGGSAAVRIESTKLFSNSSYDAVINFYGANGLLIDRSTISGNGCGNTYCALHQPGSSTGSVTIRDSLVATNGGGITMVRGRIENSTVSGNRLPSYGVAVVEGTADVSVFSSTIVRNERSNEGVILAGVLVANSIVAENTPAGAECGGITSGGHNLFGTGCTSSSLQPTDLLGSEAVPLVPMLAPLRNYGGPTNSHALLVGSPAVDAGDPSPPGSSPTACLATDQRGTPRNGDGDGDSIGRCDIGAYELREACSDLEDNDGDGSTDTLDPGCQNVAATTESPKCQDGIDNDGDGKFDFDGGASANGGVALGEPDPQCGGVAWKTKEAASCGIGAELSGVLFLLHLARRRRRWVERVSLP